jgi:alkylhydroperoxidase family enzyme
MSFIERIRWGEAEPRVQRVFETLYEARGNVPNLFRVMGRRPELLSSFNAHFGKVMGEVTLSMRRKELIAVRVSMLNECRY